MKAAKKIDGENAKRNGTKEVFLAPEAIMAKFFVEREGPKSTIPEKWFKAGLRLAPNDLPTRQAVAEWALEKGNLPFAKEQAYAALRIEARNCEDKSYRESTVGRMLRGRVALWEKDWPAAEKNFQKVISRTPTTSSPETTSSWPLSSRTTRPRSSGRWPMRKPIIESTKTIAEALSTLGWVHYRRGEFDQARIALEEAIRAASGITDPDLATYYGHILHHNQQSWQAKNILEDVLKNDRYFAMSRRPRSFTEM